ncbi:hypothetical protein B0T10DRAFT_453710 [Thelonectria olida]|uniref:Mid2 domain-containing protein n=1 Tax=Thelonectria olida TaxID=1576542 RepID=A0A9P8WGF3_9HYPO|nr:hypothetical protein B0T10DRAFT_453710 [Thelonectria olida]
MSLRRHPTSLRLWLVAALLAPTTTALPASLIFARADTCTVSCGSDLPSSLCCTSGTKCIILAGKTTVVCCPTGSTCKTIKPVTCDISQQNGTDHPGSTIKTSVLDVALETCGEQCCPFGYTCKDGDCEMNSDQSEAPGSSSSTTTSAVASATSASDNASTATAETTATDAASATDVASADATATDPASTDAAAEGSGDGESKDKDSGPATTSIIGGVVGACIGLLVIGIIIFFYIRRKKKSDAIRSEKSGAAYGHGRSPSSNGSFGNIISEPIAQPGSYRTDFILKSPSNSRTTVAGSGSGMTPSGTTPSRSSPSRTSYSRASTLMRSASSIIRVHPTPPRIRISIPNPFNSPNPSPNHHSAQPSPTADDEAPRHGTVRLAPIRAMRATSHCSRRPSTPELQREPSSESINVYTEPGTVKSRPLTRGTTFTDLMDEADLAAVRRGSPYVPGTTPKI